jgi:hypothetical protein
VDTNPQARSKGAAPMVEIITILGIFVIGATVGIVAVVSLGIRREEQRFRRERRFREEHGIWGSPQLPTHYLAELPDNAVSSVSRSLNGLFVRHLPADLPARADLGQGS